MPIAKSVPSHALGRARVYHKTCIHRAKMMISNGKRAQAIQELQRAAEWRRAIIVLKLPRMQVRSMKRSSLDILI